MVECTALEVFEILIGDVLVMVSWTPLFIVVHVDPKSVVVTVSSISAISVNGT